MKIGILNSNTGNVENVIKSVKYLGFKPIMIEEKNQLLKLSHLIIPGVGSFPRMMDFLKKSQIEEILKNYSYYNLKIMGICLGMHILFENGQELNKRRGLNLIKGNIKKINLSFSNDKKKFVPNFGYHKIQKKNLIKKYSIFDKFNFKNFYFSHSFKAYNYPANKNIFEITYFNEPILAMIISNNYLLGCQFHPELSGEQGLEVIDSFFKWDH